MSIPAQFKYLLLIVLFALGSVNFTRTALEIINNSKRLDNLNDEVSLLRQQKTDLEGKVAYKKTDAFVEEVARNDLNMIKPGEKVYILDDLTNKASSINTGNSENSSFNAGPKPFFDNHRGNISKEKPLQAWLSLLTRP